MKLCRASVYYYDANDGDGTCELETLLDNSRYISGRLFNVEEVEIGEWYDEIKINYTTATQADYDLYFNIDHELINKMVEDFHSLWNTREYTGLSYEEIVTKILLRNRELSANEKQHFMGQLQ